MGASETRTESGALHIHWHRVDGRGGTCLNSFALVLVLRPGTLPCMQSHYVDMWLLLLFQRRRAAIKLCIIVGKRERERERECRKRR